MYNNEQFLVDFITLVLVLYMLFIPFIDNSFIIYSLDNTFSKVLFVFVVISLTYYNTSLGLLLTLAYILSINYRYPKKYKKQYNNKKSNNFNVDLDNKNYYKYDFNY